MGVNREGILPPCHPCPMTPLIPPSHSSSQFIYADALHDLAVERVKRQRAGAGQAELDRLEDALVRYAPVGLETGCIGVGTITHFDAYNNTILIPHSGSVWI